MIRIPMMLWDIFKTELLSKEEGNQIPRWNTFFSLDVKNESQKLEL